MSTLKDKMLTVNADVNTQVAERDELVEMIAIALPTRKNLFILGAPGQAKSYAINELADDILCQLRKDEIVVSDRKYLNYYPIAQAKAWLSGHTQVEPQDLLALKNYLWQKPAERSAVESELNRMCINPMRDKVNSILGMSAEAKEEFGEASEQALIKLRGELLRLYGDQQKLASEAQSDSERQMTDGLLTDLENISRQAHEAVGFTYTPLEQLAALR